jgi:hypothetical protein
MNRYFSRLAQRSGINASAPTARLGNSASQIDTGWGEQTFETVASGDAITPAPREGNVEVPEAILDKSKTIDSDPERVIHSTPLVAKTVIDSMDNNISSHAQHQTDDDLMISTASSANSIDAQSQPSRAGQPIEADTLDDKAPKTTAALGNKVSSVKAVSATKKHESANAKKVLVKTGLGARISSEDSEPVIAFSEVPTEALVRSASAKSQATEIGDHRYEESNTPARSLTRSGLTPSTQSSVRGEKLATVKSEPIHVITPAVQQVRSSSNSSIEVNIGKIELEIIAPAKKVTPAPVVAASKTQRTKPAAVFNPHRYYLRGR